MRTLRPRSLTLLVCLFLSSIFLITSPHLVRAQSSELITARQDLVQAFQAIQTAEQLGASNADLLPLTAQLNTALQYEEAADLSLRQGNVTLSVQYAVQSINISTQVSSQAQGLASIAQTAAQGLASIAQTATVYRTALSYTLAIVLALLSALAILEVNRIRQLLRRRRLLKARIDYGGREHAT